MCDEGRFCANDSRTVLTLCNLTSVAYGEVYAPCVFAMPIIAPRRAV